MKNRIKRWFGVLFLKIEHYKKLFIWEVYRLEFKNIGNNSYIEYPFQISGSKYIQIGCNFGASSFFRIEAMDFINGESFSPEIIIGDNVSINRDCHIGCINKIRIGNNVLIASKVYITDHVHGETTSDSLLLPPDKRRIVSKGPVIIEDNVWIGENVIIMPNVCIGKNSIIGASSVVTKDVPCNSVVVGIPAKSIKQII